MQLIRGMKTICERGSQGSEEFCVCARRTDRFGGADAKTQSHNVSASDVEFEPENVGQLGGESRANSVAGRVHIYPAVS